MSVRVWVTHRFVGFHSWASAPERRAYLRDRHRHLFHVRVDVDVTHEDREIEFHDLLAVVEYECRNLQEFGGSCESIARFLGEGVAAEYPGRRLTVEVSEDGENGATVELEPM